MSCAEDERGWANVMVGILAVEPEGETLLLSPEEAARWKPDYGAWNDCVAQFYQDGAG